MLLLGSSDGAFGTFGVGHYGGMVAPMGLSAVLDLRPGASRQFATKIHYFAMVSLQNSFLELVLSFCF